MNGILIGYARVTTADRDLTSQRDALVHLGVLDANIYVDHGLTGTNRARPGLREALAAVRQADTFVVTKRDRLGRSVRDARDISDELTTKGVALSLGGSRYDPTDPVGRLLFKTANCSAAAWHSSPHAKHVSSEPALSRRGSNRSRATDRVGSEVP